MSGKEIKQCPCYGYRRGTITRCNCNCFGCQAIAGCKTYTADGKLCRSCK